MKTIKLYEIRNGCVSMRKSDFRHVFMKRYANNETGLLAAIMDMFNEDSKNRQLNNCLWSFPGEVIHFPPRKGESQSGLAARMKEVIESKNKNVTVEVKHWNRHANDLTGTLAVNS